MRARNFLRSTAARSLETIVGITKGLIMLPLMIHFLGEDLYGIWIVLGSIIAGLHVFDVGMAASVTRFISHSLSRGDRAEASEIVSTAMAIYVGLGTVVFLATLTMAGLAPLVMSADADTSLIRKLIIIIGLVVALEFPAKAYAGIAGYHLRQDLLAYSKITFSVVGASITAYLLYLGYQLMAVALVSLATSICGTLTFVAIANYLEPKVHVRPGLVSRTTFRSIFNFSVWTFMMDFSRVVKERGDIWLIAAFLSTSTLSVYYVGLRLVDYLNQLIFRAVSITIPLFTESVAKQDNKELLERVTLFLRINAMLASAVYGGAVIFGPDVLLAWMGQDFDGQTAYSVLVIVLGGRLMFFINNPQANVLFAMGRHKYLAYISFLEAGASFLLIYLSIGLLDYKVTAAAFSIALPLLFTRLLILPLIVARYSPVKPFKSFKDLLVILIPSGAFITIAYWLKTAVGPIDFLPSLIAAMALYMALITLLFALISRPAERQLVLRALRNR